VSENFENSINILSNYGYLISDTLDDDTIKNTLVAITLHLDSNNFILFIRCTAENFLKSAF